MGNCKSFFNEEKQEDQLEVQMNNEFHAYSMDNEYVKKNQDQENSEIQLTNNIPQTITSINSSIQNIDQTTIKLADGSTYVGKVNKNNLPNGNGTQTWPNGDVFTGYFLQGQKNGIGKLEKKDNFVYEGNFSRNKISGQGRMRLFNGQIYTGEFKDGKFEGEGELITPDGKKIKGLFKKGEYVGSNQLVAFLISSQSIFCLNPF